MHIRARDCHRDEIGTANDRAALERAITNEMRERFVVAGVELDSHGKTKRRCFPGAIASWQGAAYSISGKYLFWHRAANSRATFASSLVGRDGRVEGASNIRSRPRGRRKTRFDKLMSKLDGKVETVAQTEEEESGEVKFFSENLSRFVAAQMFRISRSPSNGREL